ncbi:hypothetical protein PRIPAC_88510, partial [Pristionchus pacificus]|uniref:Uncharacterized protein n=1 Tax=Pristionchus pacificus TaxID=54126 RepID=A0A2A6CWQ8_PRIPA
THFSVVATNTTPSIFSSLVSSFAYKIPHFIPHFALLPLITTPSSHLERSPSLLFSLSLFDEGSPPAPLARSRWDFCPHRCRSLLLRVRVRERSLRALLLRRMPTGRKLSRVVVVAERPEPVKPSSSSFLCI